MVLVKLNSNSINSLELRSTELKHNLEFGAHSDNKKLTLCESASS